MRKIRSPEGRSCVSRLPIRGFLLIMQQEDGANFHRKALEKPCGKYGGLEYSMHIADRLSSDYSCPKNDFIFLRGF